MLTAFVDWIFYDVLSLDGASRPVAALHFFVYDSIKIFLLLAVMIFLIGFARTWLPQEKLKGWMSRGGLWGNVLAALFGAITPFCSCSSIPLFISFLKAGVPLGVTFSFLITSPIINEYLVILMASEFGLPITLAYVANGLLIGTLAGALLGRMKMEDQLEADITRGCGCSQAEKAPRTLAERIRFGCEESADVIRRIWKWVLIGVGIGAFIHNYVPQDTIHGVMEATGPFSVPIATILGVPLYGSCAAIVPIAVVLFEKGIPIGTALAFMMAMAALSMPEAIMLRRTMRLKLIVLFFLITTLGIIATGMLLNFLHA